MYAVMGTVGETRAGRKASGTAQSFFLWLNE